MSNSGTPLPRLRGTRDQVGRRIHDAISEFEKLRAKIPTAEIPDLQDDLDIRRRHTIELLRALFDQEGPAAEFDNETRQSVLYTNTSDAERREEIADDVRQCITQLRSLTARLDFYRPTDVPASKPAEIPPTKEALGPSPEPKPEPETEPVPPLVAIGLFIALLIIIAALILWRQDDIANLDKHPTAKAPFFLIISLVPAILLFGLFKTVARATGRLYGLTVTLGGPAALFVVVLLTLLNLPKSIGTDTTTSNTDTRRTIQPLDPRVLQRVRDREAAIRRYLAGLNQVTNADSLGLFFGPIDQVLVKGEIARWQARQTLLKTCTGDPNAVNAEAICTNALNQASEVPETPVPGHVFKFVGDPNREDVISLLRDTAQLVARGDGTYHHSLVILVKGEWTAHAGNGNCTGIIAPYITFTSNNDTFRITDRAVINAITRQEPRSPQRTFSRPWEDAFVITGWPTHRPLAAVIPGGPEAAICGNNVPYLLLWEASPFSSDPFGAPAYIPRSRR